MKLTKKQLKTLVHEAVREQLNEAMPSDMDKIRYELALLIDKERWYQVKVPAPVVAKRLGVSAEEVVEAIKSIPDSSDLQYHVEIDWDDPNIIRFGDPGDV